jgi:hypothetical protein
MTGTECQDVRAAHAAVVVRCGSSLLLCVAVVGSEYVVLVSMVRFANRPGMQCVVLWSA